MSSKRRESLTSPSFIDQLRNRDPAALTVVIHAYTRDLYRAALGLGFDSVRASDLVQMVWTTFLDVASRFEGRSHVRTFVFGILYNKACELRRQENRLDTKDPIEDILDKRFDAKGAWMHPPINPEQFLIAAETRALIEKCLDALPLAQRMAFTLKEIDENDSPEICKILGVTLTNLGVLLYRARNRLRECIEGKAQT